MTRRLLFTLTLAATALVPVAAADAAKPAPYPAVSKVEPLSLGIGDTLKLTGKNFTAGKNKNTVVFKRDGRKAVFVKAHAATKTTLSVTVPEKLRGSLGKKDGAEVPTRFRLRVLSKRFAKTYTALKSSPTIAPKGKAILAEEKKAAVAEALQTLAAAAAPVPAPPPPDCDNDGTPDDADANDDKDGLTDALEAQLKTDRCNVDTDGDGMEDGWEYKSAFDLNDGSCPETPYPVACNAAQPASTQNYPVKKPYPNPLDPADVAVDFDGDYLAAGLEHEAWKRKVGTVRDLSVPLWYSDGLQASIDEGHSTTCRGMQVPPPLGKVEYAGAAYQVYSLDRFGRKAYDGCLNDGERDEDGDWLSNRDEVFSALSGVGWWTGNYEEPPYRIIFEGTEWLDWDTDGDGILDAKDDQDHDDFWNIEEMVRGQQSVTKDNVFLGPTNGLWVDAFNPCLPAILSRTCPPTELLKGEPWRPFYKEEEPLPRWPLYGTAQMQYYSNEHWTGMPQPQQTLPPTHPLPRCPVGQAPNCV